MAVNTGITKLDAATTSYSAKTTVVGQPDVPGLSTAEMQETVEYMPRNFLLPKLNEVIDSLNSTYSAAETQQAINDKVTEIGSADMRKSQYDPDSVGYTFTNVKTNAQNIASAQANLNKMNWVKVCLYASKWSSSAPYTQTVSIPWMTADWYPGVPMASHDAAWTTDWVNSNREQLAKLTLIKSDTGTLTFYCFDDKPDGDLWVKVPGLGLYLGDFYG